MRKLILPIICALSACSSSPLGDSVEPPGPSDPVLVAGVIVSGPVAVNVTTTGGGTSSYVAMVPGTAPGATTATITNLSSGVAVRALVLGGGFDAQRIGASTDDVLDIAVTGASGRVTHAYDTVRAGVAPRIVRTIPSQGATGVTPYMSVQLALSEPVATLSPSAPPLVLRDGALPVAASVTIDSLDPSLVHLVPLSPLTPGTAYELVIMASLTGISGRTLGASTTIDLVTASPTSAVASVVVSPASGTLVVGQTMVLTATPKDAAGAPIAGGTVTWASSNPAAATVSATGVVTANATGSAVIAASSEGKSGTATISVVATPAPVATVSVTPANATVTVGQATQLTASVRDASGATLLGRAIAWTSSNLAVASVTSDGTVTAISAGTTTVTVTCEGKASTATITVVTAPAPVASLTVTPSAATLPVGQTTQFSYTAFNAAGGALVGRSVTWTSSSPAVATVSASGLVTAVAMGTATVTVTSEGKSALAAVTVVPPKPVASVWVDRPYNVLLLNNTIQLGAILQDADFTVVNRPVTWSSSDPAVATVSGTGLVRGVAVGGPVTITATSEGISGTASVTVWALTPPQLGAIAVVVTTTGMDQDPDGYLLGRDVGSFGNVPSAIATNETVTMSGLSADQRLYSFWLADIDPNCAVDLPRQAVSVQGNATTVVRFNVTCQARTSIPTDGLEGVWVTDKWELFRDAALTSRFIDLAAEGDTGQLIVGPANGSSVKWQWHDNVTDGMGVFAGSAAVNASAISSNLELWGSGESCCGWNQNSPITGVQSYVRTGEQLVITSTAPANADTDYGSFAVWFRLTLRRIR